MMRCLYVLAFLSLIAAPGHTQTQKQDASGLTLQKTIALPIGSGKFDHLAFDEKAGRLFVAGSSAHQVQVLDVRSGKVIETISKLGKPHGLAWIPETGRLFVADGSLATLNVYEGSPLKLVKTLKLSDDADDMVYDSLDKVLYVGHGGSGPSAPPRVALIDAERLELIANLPVASHPEALEIDPRGRRVFVNVADSNQVAVINADTHTITQTWTLQRAGHNVPLAYDEASHTLLIGCRTPARVLVVDPDLGQETADAASSAGADDLFYDPKTHIAYLVAGSGKIDVYRLISKKLLEPTGSVSTSPGAKTGLLVSAISTLFIAVPEGTGQAADVLVFSTKK